MHHALFIDSSYKTWHLTSTLRHSTCNNFRYSSFRNSYVKEEEEEVVAFEMLKFIFYGRNGKGC